jgi:hypothetical protein
VVEGVHGERAEKVGAHIRVVNVRVTSRRRNGSDPFRISGRLTPAQEKATQDGDPSLTSEKPLVLSNGLLWLLLVLEPEATSGDEERCVTLLYLSVMRGRPQAVDESFCTWLTAPNQPRYVPQ